MVLVTQGKDRQFVGIFIGEGDAEAFIQLAIEEDDDLGINDFLIEQISRDVWYGIKILFNLKGD